MGAVGSIAAAGISWLGDVAIMREVRHQTAYLQKQIDELDLQVRWLTTAVKILQAAANKENEACAVIETLANQVRLFVPCQSVRSRSLSIAPLGGEMWLGRVGLGVADGFRAAGGVKSPVLFCLVVHTPCHKCRLTDSVLSTMDNG